MLGDEEILENSTRKYTAVVSSTAEIYTLSKEVMRFFMFSILEIYFPDKKESCLYKASWAIESKEEVEK